MVTNVFVSSPVAPSAPQDDIIYQAPSVKLIVYDKEIGTGTLHVTRSNVVWSSAASPAPRISLLYPTISFHGIQRHPSPALCVIMNYELKSVFPNLAPQPTSNEDNDDDYDPEDQPITQLRFVPQNTSDLEALHSALDEGQTLHPDPADEVYDDENFEGDVFDSAADVLEEVMFANTMMVTRLQIEELQPSIEDYQGGIGAIDSLTEITL
ncbi:methylosome subunit pICln-like isoform X2 [Pectinophora gossypiella]|uniref:methylosome subunit pICln-like isoform X2 n=1 Tax=Pectinophora gossypiella TaxID=13191 RepID=UPI00214EFB87|nr:methylosome subunit pICln-like isoform X2 [Pectinophora gossypiella]